MKPTFDPYSPIAGMLARSYLNSALEQGGIGLVGRLAENMAYSSRFPEFFYPDPNPKRIGAVACAIVEEADAMMEEGGA